MVRKAGPGAEAEPDVLIDLLDIWFEQSEDVRINDIADDDLYDHDDIQRAVDGK